MSHEIFDRKVDGMICPQCEDEIAHRLLHTRGILSCTASYRKSTVTANFDPDILLAEDIERILAETGYPVGDGRSGRRRVLSIIDMPVGGINELFARREDAVIRHHRSGQNAKRGARRRLRCALCYRPAHGRALHRHVRRHPARAGQCAAL